MKSTDLVELHAELLAHYGEDLDQLLEDLTFAVRDERSAKLELDRSGLNDVALQRRVSHLN